MSKFLTELKKFLMKDDYFLESNVKPVGYYNVILQNQEELAEVISDCENYHLEFRYDSDNEEGCTDGSISIYLYTKSLHEDYSWQSVLNYYYRINFEDDERSWGYCECSPSDVGYNPLHRCCGAGCDWYAPAVNVTKVESKGYFKFDGQERDLWKMESEWELESGISKEQLEQQEKERQLQYIDEEIQELLKQKELFLKVK